MLMRNSSTRSTPTSSFTGLSILATTSGNRLFGNPSEPQIYLINTSAFLSDRGRGRDGDSSIVDEFSGVNGAGQEARD